MSTEQISALVGIIMPIIITLIKRTKLEPVYNAMIAIGVCAGFGVLISWLNGSFTGATVAAAIAIVYGVASGLYATFWKVDPMAKLETKLNVKTG